MNAVCPKLYNPKAFKHLKLAGLLACSILDAFPFRLGTVAFRDFEDTFGAYSSGVCSGFSPDSLFTHHPKNRGMSTKFSGKYTEDFLICKHNCDIYRKSSFIHPIPPPILSLYLHFIQRRTNLLINSIYWVVVLTTPDAISYTGNV